MAKTDRFLWESHPNFHPVAFKIMRSHDRFRDHVANLRNIQNEMTSIETTEDRCRVLAVQADKWYTDLVEVILEHHHVEEDIIMPYLVQHFGFDPITTHREHEELLPLLGNLSNQIRRLKDGSVEPEDRIEIKADLEEVERLLITHIENEESCMMPYLLMLSNNHSQAMFTGTGRI